MSRELIILLNQKIDEMKRLPVFSKPAAAEAVVGLAVSIITDHENRLIQLEGGTNGKNSETAGRNGGRVDNLPRLQHAGAHALGAE